MEREVVMDRGSDVWRGWLRTVYGPDSLNVLGNSAAKEAPVSKLSHC